MPQFDVFRTANGNLLLDCQSDALGYLDTRVVVPLVRAEDSPERRARLNPVFQVAAVDHVLLTQFATAMRLREVGDRIDNLAAYRYEIIGALDMLLTGV